MTQAHTGCRYSCFPLLWACVENRTRIVYAVHTARPNPVVPKHKQNLHTSTCTLGGVVDSKRENILERSWRKWRNYKNDVGYLRKGKNETELRHMTSKPLLKCLVRLSSDGRMRYTSLVCSRTTNGRDEMLLEERINSRICLWKLERFCFRSRPGNLVEIIKRAVSWGSRGWQCLMFLPRTFNAPQQKTRRKFDAADKITS